MKKSKVKKGPSKKHSSPHLETVKNFEKRKGDHIRLALESRNEAVGLSELDRVQLIHEALPDLNFKDLKINSSLFKNPIAAPFFVSSMTAGHAGGVDLNRVLAETCARKGWPMGVGSQRRELGDPQSAREWSDLRKRAPDVLLMGNLGLAQVILTKTSDIERLVQSLEAVALIVHTNPLQECMQPEGTPEFKGGLAALQRVCSELSVPVVLKETGCGFSLATLKSLSAIGLAVVDVAGLGGTHWGRIEGMRSKKSSLKEQAAQVFQNWGISTVESLSDAVVLKQKGELKTSVWASGGIRSGLDAAKLLSMGADMVGFAKPALQAALKGSQSLESWMNQMEFELKVAMFCTGSATLEQLQESVRWKRI